MLLDHLKVSSAVGNFMTDYYELSVRAVGITLGRIP